MSKWIIVLIAVVLLGLVGFFVLNKTREQSDESRIDSSAHSQSETRTFPRKSANPNEPPLKLKNMGINIDTYDPSTGMAGDLTFTKATFTSGIPLLFTDYAYVIKANSANPQDKANPQPTFIAPLGTKVHSLVDGVVFEVPKLYSNDYSVQVYDGKDASWVWELEHVINPLVKKGDKVTAGQVVAEVSDYSKHGYDGQGLFEIGLLRGGNPPRHVCPFAYVDDSVKAEVQQKLTTLYKDWEAYRGNTSLYDESALKMPGCLTLDPIEG